MSKECIKCMNCDKEILGWYEPRWQERDNNLCVCGNPKLSEEYEPFFDVRTCTETRRAWRRRKYVGGLIMNDGEVNKICSDKEKDFIVPLSKGSSSYLHKYKEKIPHFYENKDGVLEIYPEPIKMNLELEDDPKMAPIPTKMDLSTHEQD